MSLALSLGSSRSAARAAPRTLVVLVAMLPAACFDPDPVEQTDGDDTSAGPGSSSGIGPATDAGSSSEGGTTPIATDTGDSSSGTGGETTSTTGDCVEDELLCLGDCIDPDTDQEHCGASDDCAGANAGVACGPDQECTNGQCTCLGVQCGDECIDPQTDATFCGASGDCLGTNAGQACGPSAACTAGACIDSCDNCGFETGDFNGWTAVDLPEPYQPLIVTQGGQAFNMHIVTPTEGMYCVMNGFDGGGPGTIEVGQDITLAMAPPADLLFDYSAAWNVGGAMARTFDVAIEPAGGGPPMDLINVLTAPGNSDNQNTGNLLGMIDLSPYAGQTIFIRFVWNIPEFFTGPAQAQLDNVRIVPQ